MTDNVYWRTLADMCAVQNDSDEEEEGSPEATFARDVHAECESSHSFTQVSNGIAVGNIDAAESRLLLHLRGIKSVLYASSHEMDPLWEKDGIRYHTLIVPSAKESSAALASSLGSACAFLSKNKPALICSSCPKLRATVAAALLHFETPIEMPVADAIDRLTELGVLSESEALSSAEHSALTEFSSADFSAMGYGTMSPHMVPESPRAPLALAGFDISTPASIGKRAAPPMDMSNKAFKLNPREDSPLPMLNNNNKYMLPSSVERTISEEAL
jgi:hypothetical protein